MISLKKTVYVLPLAALIVAGGTVIADAKGRGNEDPSIDGHTKIEVHARYPGDNIVQGKYGKKEYYERCNWFSKGSIWGGDRPLGLTQGCARLEVPRDRSDDRN